MSLYPDVQRKAQEELDNVVGSSRLPDFGDHDGLVYIQAIALEAMRWMVVTPLGGTHRVTADDEYRGFFIPKGTSVMPNIWSATPSIIRRSIPDIAWCLRAMLHNPDDYPEPIVFKPERYIKDGKLDPSVRDPLTLAFGFGRRICPGRYLAIGSLFITIASVLHTFNIEPTISEDGKVFDPFSSVVSGVVSSPEYVPCKVTPRSDKAEQLIQESSV
ncbi:hypothetical protein QCA50_019380 [Cerrena zonata]|uniref:Cytochrome P450 n=1 Tax=Cerrena zonata TaxID=2478898 RepID=A0AAW0FFK8_9APHY